MKVHTSIIDLKGDLNKFLFKKQKIGFVPTMGALHSGHISLVEKSKSENHCTIVSIFVNPFQFNNPSDLEKYPRNPEKDFAMLEKAEVDFVFSPEVSEIYPDKNVETYDFGDLANVMEGEFRPGHFDGVAAVVRRFFSIVEPTNAYFGEKDFQQLAIIKKMVNDYSIPVNIVACPIIREKDGLAMSSRNMRLSEEERKSAKEIFKIVSEAKNNMNSFEVKELERFVVNQINQIPYLKTEYFQIVDSETLQPIDSLNDAKSITACLAVFAGDIRLIDSIKFK